MYLQNLSLTEFVYTSFGLFLFYIEIVIMGYNESHTLATYVFLDFYEHPYGLKDLMVYRLDYKENLIIIITKPPKSPNLAYINLFRRLCADSFSLKSQGMNQQ
jgi:hypothetical protein